MCLVRESMSLLSLGSIHRGFGHPTDVSRCTCAAAVRIYVRYIAHIFSYMSHISWRRLFRGFGNPANVGKCSWAAAV